MRNPRRAAAYAAFTFSLLAVRPAAGQEHRHPAAALADSAAADSVAMPTMAGMTMQPGPLGTPRTREGSGTAWLPDASPMHALHRQAGDWELMLHGSLFIHYLDDGGDRGREQFGATNWIMGMARRPAAGGDMLLRAMLSADPVTATDCGYPDLLATGEFCDDEPLHDRQHPHDLFMELAGVYERALGDDLALQLYGGPVGEPALGPVAFPHRISSFPNPIAPVGHHWLDSTHIAFGVATAGVYGRRWKAEGSLFNGREPDAERYDFDLDALDSYAGRFWLLPNERWGLQISAGRLNEAEVHEVGGPRIDVTRVTASASYHRPLADEGGWASTIAWGRNREGSEATHAFLAEASLNLAERDILYGRLEVAEKTGGDLVLPEELEERSFTVGKLGLGYLRQIDPVAGLVPGFGAGVTVSRVPEDLESFYGSTTPAGLQLFFRLRPAPMMTEGHGR
ncbi:MAG TPA: hypothetical protein VFG78_00650 [Gemmatimonadota bacterium]|nr:hypothetical protein [Gemmatimonadota bacterium]